MMENATLVMPEWAIWLIGLGLTWLMTQGLKSLSKTIPWIPTISGQATAVVAAVVALIVSASNAVLLTIPPDYVPAVDATFKFVAMLLSAYGVSYTLKDFRAMLT
jgi:hypothetical protein